MRTAGQPVKNPYAKRRMCVPMREHALVRLLCVNMNVNVLASIVIVGMSVDLISKRLAQSPKADSQQHDTDKPFTPD